MTITIENSEFSFQFTWWDNEKDPEWTFLGIGNGSYMIQRHGPKTVWLWFPVDSKEPRVEWSDISKTFKDKGYGRNYKVR